MKSECLLFLIDKFDQVIVSGESFLYDYKEVVRGKSIHLQ